MACRARSAQHQDHPGHGAAELPDPDDGHQGDLGLPARLQSHPADDGSGGAARRLPAAPTQLQAHRAALDRRGIIMAMASTATRSCMACLSSSLNSGSATAPAVSSPGPSNDDQNPTRCSPNHARSPERTSENMVTPKSLSKCHSNPAPYIR